MNAYTAVELAMAGADGPSTVFEGPFGVYQTLAGLEGLEVDTGSLGRHWEILGVTTKPYPACNFIHASLDCLEKIRTASPVIAAADIEGVEVVVAPQLIPTLVEPRSVKDRPLRAYDAKFSIQYCVARHLVDGRLTTDSFTDDSLADPAVLGLAERIRFDVQPDADFPRLSSTVRLRTRDLQVFETTVPDAKGSPKNPLTAADIERKFQDNTSRALPTAVAQEISERFRRFDDETDLRELSKLWTEAAARPIGRAV